MRKSTKGFTLVECIIAMGVLAVSSLLLVQAYTQLMTMTNMNNTIYTSISDQMADVERSDTNHAKLLSPGITASKYSSGQGRDFVFDKVPTPTGSGPLNITSPERKYKTNVEVYITYPYVNHTMTPDTGADPDPDKSGTDVRYIYFHR